MVHWDPSGKPCDCEWPLNELLGLVAAEGRKGELAAQELVLALDRMICALVKRLLAKQCLGDMVRDLSPGGL